MRYGSLRSLRIQIGGLGVEELDISKHVYSLSMRRGMFVWRNKIPDGCCMGHRRDSGLYQSPLRCDQVTGDSDP